MNGLDRIWVIDEDHSYSGTTIFSRFMTNMAVREKIIMRELAFVKRRHVLNVVHAVLAWHLFLFGVFALVEIVYAVYDKVNQGAAEINGLGAACMAITAVLAIAFIGFRAYLKRVDREMDALFPFVSSLPFCSEGEVLDALNAHLRLRPLNDNSLYGCSKGKRTVHLFVICADDFDAEAARSAEERCLTQAINRHWIKDKAPKEEWAKTAFVNVFLVNRLNESAAAFLQERISLEGLSPAMRVILDLETMELHIPGCFGRDPSPSAMYAYCMEKFIEWLNVEE